MNWLQSNWIWLVVVGGFIAMHLFGHGGHRHGRDNREPGTGDTNAKNENDLAQDGIQAHSGHGEAPTSSTLKQHRHGC